MEKVFNVNGVCRPEKHYMVDLGSRLRAIRKMVDDGEYFTINRARQFGKTTTLNALADFLKNDYEVVCLDVQMMDSLSYENPESFVAAFAEELLESTESLPDEIEEQLQAFVRRTAKINSLNALFKVIKLWCGKSGKAIVLMIDEVDTATNNQIFLDFLAQLRAYYLKRPKVSAFHSVILAGVYDVRNTRRKIRLDEEHKNNSPWNIAADFNVDMCFSASDIAGMLRDYEADHHTGMDIEEMSELIYNYTSGYPYLSSRLCKLIDEQISEGAGFADKAAAWTRPGLLEAVKILVNDLNTLFLSMKRKVEDYPELRAILYDLLFAGRPVPYTAMNDCIEIAAMFGFIRNEEGTAVIHNRIFETVLYNWFMSEEYGNSKIYDTGLREKSRFLREVI